MLWPAEPQGQRWKTATVVSSASGRDIVRYDAPIAGERVHYHVQVKKLYGFIACIGYGNNTSRFVPAYWPTVHVTPTETAVAPVAIVASVTTTFAALRAVATLTTIPADPSALLRTVEALPRAAAAFAVPIALLIVLMNVVATDDARPEVRAPVLVLLFGPLLFGAIG